MEPFIDYHAHTTFSCDARDTMDAMCRRAIELGLQEIVFTEHVDFEHLDSCYRYFKPASYFEAIEEARRCYGDRLLIRTGAEVGEPHRYPDETAELLEAYPFDFVIGSLHWVDGRPTFGPDFFAGWSPQAAWRAYFEELVRLCEAGDFDVLAHLDLPKRHFRPINGSFDPEPYAELIHAALQSLIQRGKGIEVNCSGLRYPVQEPLPGLRVVQWYRELGGEILTVGTDAHRTSHLGEGIDQAVKMAQVAGFETFTRFRARQPVGV